MRAARFSEPDLVDQPEIVKFIDIAQCSYITLLTLNYIDSEITNIVSFYYAFCFLVCFRLI